MRGKIVAVTTISVFIITCAVFVMGYSRVNTKYPQATLAAVGMNAELHLGGISATASECDILTYEDFVRQYPQVDGGVVSSAEIVSPDKMRVLLVSLEIRNTGETERTFMLSDVVASTVTWQNGVELEMYYLLNDKENGLNLPLQPKEEIQVQLPYLLYEFQFSPEGWDNIMEQTFKLVFSLYPEMQVIDLRELHNSV